MNGRVSPAPAPPCPQRDQRDEQGQGSDAGANAEQGAERKAAGEGRQQR
jgi:hypothetical protein